MGIPVQDWPYSGAVGNLGLACMWIPIQGLAGGSRGVAFVWEVLYRRNYLGPSLYGDSHTGKAIRYRLSLWATLDMLVCVFPYRGGGKK